MSYCYEFRWDRDQDRLSMRDVHWRLRVGCGRGFLAAAPTLRAVGLRRDVVVVGELVRQVRQVLRHQRRRSLRRSSRRSVRGSVLRAAGSHHGRVALDPAAAAAARPILARAHSTVRICPHVDAPKDGSESDSDDERRQSDGHRHLGRHAHQDQLRFRQRSSRTQWW